MRNLTFLFSIFALSLREKTLRVRPDSSCLRGFVLKLCVLCAFRSRYFPVGGMREPGMLVSEDQSLEFLTDLGYTHIKRLWLCFPKSKISSSFESGLELKIRGRRCRVGGRWTDSSVDRASAF